MQDALIETSEKAGNTAPSADFEYIKMDYSLESPQERVQKVNEIISKTPSERLTPGYLEKLADYIIFAMSKQEQKEKKILTKNMMVTINKRELSFEGLTAKLENGEDGIYNMIRNDKNIIFQPKVSITAEDVAEVPGLKELCADIEKVEAESKTATGKAAFTLKKMLIEMRKNQYILKNSYRKPIYYINAIKSVPKMDLAETISLDAEGDVKSNGFINFYEEKHISAILDNYSKLKEDSWEKSNEDAKWFMMDFDNLVDAALKDKYPLYYNLLIYKIDGKTNAEIQQLLYERFGVRHSVEYLSNLWRNKIPKLIVEEAKNEWLVWYFTFKKRGVWKKCGRCGKIKLAHNNFFSKNKASKSGYYSICKECRNKKR